MKNPMTIEGPAYGVDQLVWLLHKGQSYPTSVFRRAYDPDKAQWIYLLRLTGTWRTAEDLAPRDKRDPSDD